MNQAQSRQIGAMADSKNAQSTIQRQEKIAELEKLAIIRLRQILWRKRWRTLLEWSLGVFRPFRSSELLKGGQPIPPREHIHRKFIDLVR